MLMKRKHHSISQSVQNFEVNRGWTVILGILLIIYLLLITALFIFEAKFKNTIYPGVSVGGIDFGGKKPTEISAFWESKNLPFTDVQFEFRTDNMVATVSANQLGIGYDANLSAMQAYLVGRSGNFFTDIPRRYFGRKTDLTPLFRWKNDVLDQTIQMFSDSMDIPSEDALFTFTDGKVTSFRPSKNGLKVNINDTKVNFGKTIASLPHSQIKTFQINVKTDIVKPKITTDSANSFGIKEHIGHGYSEFTGSIAGRIHNVALAASRFNGVLIPPGQTMSFNKTLGDVSAATGYQQAYIIKEGRTVLGDGGGVCQVSTTLFRAAMDAGLPILERHAHAYRVHYYEEGGFKPGMDATVFDPSDDLKIKNDTPAYILVQTKTDLDNLTLEFDLYGTSDGRKSEIYGQRLWGVSPPPPDLYQDDPTLKVGVVKQIDFSAWGANAAFKYKVTRNGQTLLDTEFISNYRPWQAIYLRGTQP
jgi:vancomycin resistance protein YoaR